MSTAAGGQDDGGAPRGAASSWWKRAWARVSDTVPVRAARNYDANQMPDNAAALTYYAMMSIFPGLLVVFTIFGLVGDPSVPRRAAQELLDNGTDPSVSKVVNDVLDQMINASSGALSVALVVSMLLALNGASGAFMAAGRAVNRIFGYVDDRGIVRTRLISLGATLVVVLLYVVTVAAVFLGDTLAHDLFAEIGLGDEAAAVWAIIRWPVAVLSAMLTVTVVYAIAPSPPEGTPRVRILSIGASVAVLLWLAAIVLFGVYVDNVSRYGAVYGLAGTLIVLLLFLYITNTAFLYGAEINAEVQRRRQARRERLRVPDPTVATAGATAQGPPPA